MMLPFVVFISLILSFPNFVWFLLSTSVSLLKFPSMFLKVSSKLLIILFSNFLSRYWIIFATFLSPIWPPYFIHLLIEFLIRTWSIFWQFNYLIDLAFFSWKIISLRWVTVERCLAILCSFAVLAHLLEPLCSVGFTISPFPTWLQSIIIGEGL